MNFEKKFTDLMTTKKTSYKPVKDVDTLLLEKLPCSKKRSKNEKNKHICGPPFQDSKSCWELRIIDKEFEPCYKCSLYEMMHKIGKNDRKLPEASQSAREANEKLISPSSKRPTLVIPRVSPVPLFQHKAIDIENSLDDIAEEASLQGDSSSSLHLGTRSVSASAKLPSLSVKIPIATTSIKKNHSYESNPLSSSLSPSKNINESPSNSPSLFGKQSLKIESPKDTLRPTTASTACSTDFESPTALPSRRSQRGSSRSCRSVSPSSLNWALVQEAQVSRYSRVSFNRFACRKLG
mmetsp:Transcript_27418/g.26216  ORF Transcript_27418/g.26216 Transcript_27418/m.26216 type:complete len:294 (-) Transcript_27418:355-1236(-)